MPWPTLDTNRWLATAPTVHMMLQIVGKVRLALTPWLNHSWHATLYVNARGVTTGPMPGGGLTHEAQFDFIDHVLRWSRSDGKGGTVPLTCSSIAGFYGDVEALLDDMGISAKPHGAPNEVADPVPFAQQTTPAHYDGEAVNEFWQALSHIHHVFTRFRAGYLGKSSPVHLFWGSFDLAVTRFSGRKAPDHPGGVPALPDPITRDAYSHEVASAGFWGGGGGVDEAAFYAYAYPALGRYGDTKLSVPGAYWHADLGEFVLPYAAVQTAPSPQDTLLTFLQETYEAAARLGDWPTDGLLYHKPPGLPVYPGA
ncbi:MAG: DUF5996 family protein [Pseudomonadota bacterium]